MDMEERLKLAREVLGRFRVVKSHKGKGGNGHKPRKVSSFIPGTCKMEQTKKNIYRQCGKKVRYRTEHDARVYANRCETVRGARLRVYACPICNGWHITSRV